ncbi:hypothetical protein BGW39_009424 [Mortierella sp. 14UC]|nr:hypothetical protein BGW39_009424 [Mortierella sp. 14UC]
MDGPTRLRREGQPPSRTTRRPSTSHYTSTSSFGSATTHFTNDSLTFLNGLKERLPEHLQPYFWLGLWFASAVLIIGLVVGFHSKIFSALQALADFIKGLGPLWFKAQVRKLMAKNKSLKGVVRTVEKRGFRLLVLIRLAPYPYNVMNAILSATHIPLSTFIAATAISLIKLTLHVYIGSTLSTLTGGDGDNTDPNKDPNNHGKRVKVFLMVMGIILGVGVGAYVWAVAKREIAITEAARMERRRRRRGGRRHGRSAAAFTGDGGGSGGIELNDQQVHTPDVDLTNRDSVDGFYSGTTVGEGGRDLSDANHFVGGAGGSRYQDYEDDGNHEGNSLFGASGRPQQQQQGQRGDWRNVGSAGGAGAGAGSSTDSDESDYFDDSDDDDDEYEDGVDGERGDLERGFGLGLALDSERDRAVDRDRTRGFGSGGFGDDGEEALDFSAHHAGLSDSPWRDEEEELHGTANDLLGGDVGRVPSGRGATAGVGGLDVNAEGRR